jgi:hypothetical protein
MSQLSRIDPCVYAADDLGGIKAFASFRLQRFAMTNAGRLRENPQSASHWRASGTRSHPHAARTKRGNVFLLTDA